MAISKSRTKSKDMVALVDKSFLTSVDRTKDVVTNTTTTAKPVAESSKLAVAVGKKNVFVPTPSVNPDNTLAGVSDLPKGGSVSCNTPTSNIKLTPDDRRLDMPNKVDNCGTDPTTNLAIASIMKYTTAGLPESKVVAIESMLSSQIANQVKNSTSLNGVDKKTTMLNGVSSVSKALSGVGSTIKDKSGLMSLLNCSNSSGLNSYNNNLLSRLVNNGLLSQSLCVSSSKMLATINDLSASGSVTRGSLVTSVVSAFSASNERSAAEKVSIISNIPASASSNAVADVATTANSVDPFMNSLSDSYVPNKSTTAEYDNAMLALDNMNPSWNKDASGTPNLSRSKGNKYITALHTDKLKNSVVTPTSVVSGPTPLSAGDPRHTALLVAASNINTKQVTDGNQIRA